MMEIGKESEREGNGVGVRVKERVEDRGIQRDSRREGQGRSDNAAAIDYQTGW